MGALDSKPPILIAGGGIAGLTVALAFARKGFTVEIFEQATSYDTVGAGIQLSPNATRILGRLGVLDSLASAAVQPDAVVLRRARDLEEIARVPMGRSAERRWGARYLTCHRADLQAALLDAVADQSAIKLTTGAKVRDFAFAPPRLAVEIDKAIRKHTGALVVAADGVWSAIRAHGGSKGESRFIGQLAWRRKISADHPHWRALAGDGPAVTAFLHPHFHLVAYPMRGGADINLAAFTRFKRDLPRGWLEKVDPIVLREAMRDASSALAGLAEEDVWTAFPIHVADLDGSWSDPGGLALVGDAAHAMTPFAAQGAAMAIEDAATLADAISTRPDDPAGALQDWTIGRRRRVLRVARRGALNQFAWHASGPVAAARDAFLKWRGPERLAADLDWLYGWREG